MPLVTSNSVDIVNLGFQFKSVKGITFVNLNMIIFEPVMN